MRRFVIGDVHGCSKALRTLLEKLAPTSEDLIVFLGDFIDRGPDSRGVIDQVVELSRSSRVVAIRGNHELMLMGVLFGGCDPEIWLKSGGASTLASYGGSLERIATQHGDFFRSLRAHHETDKEIFIHAGYEPDVPIERCSDTLRYWSHFTSVPPPHCSGKRVFVGHTPQGNGNVLNRGHFVCMDTYCFGGGWLTAMDLDTDEVLQVNRHGHARRNFSLRFSQLLMSWFGKRVHARTTASENDEKISTTSAEGHWQSKVVTDQGSAP
jgi:serine/threonine protein phosphatase 1